MDRLTVSDHRRPWTPATPEESQVRCCPFLLKMLLISTF